MAAVLQCQDPLDRLLPHETVFLRTVLEHRGVAEPPSLNEFRRALEVLIRYDAQCQDNPADSAWLPDVDEEQLIELRAKAFIMFGATKPTPAQWQKANAALYGPPLCETCQ